MTLPPVSDLTPAELAAATWADIRPLFEELVARPLGREQVPAWLADWSRLDEVLSEAAGLAMIAYTCDTADPVKEATHLRFSAEILPQIEEYEVKLADRLLALDWQAPGMEVTIARFRTASEIFREANVALTQEVEEHSTRYQRITGSLTVQWDGVEKALPQLQPFLQSPDRVVRERAFRGQRGLRQPPG